MGGEILVLSNPHKRRKHKAKRKHHRRTRARRKAHFYARRNPVVSLKGPMSTVAASGIGALGGLMNDVLMGFVRPKLPNAMQGDLAIGGLKVLTALGIGFAANFVKRGSGRALAVGAATCALHDAARNLVLAKFPNSLGEYVSMGSIGEYVLEPNRVGDYPSTAIPVSGDEGMGEYVSGGSGYDNA